MKLWCATTNIGKLREFQLGSLDVEPLPNMQEIEVPNESGASFEENAALKAVYYSKFVDGLVFADDSGLEVDSLGGEPGIYSARFAGVNAGTQANNTLLLQRLAGVSNRNARFVCVIALARSGRLETSFRGEVRGEITSEYRGNGGFGYDPLFFYPPLNCTLADIGEIEKFQISHRGIAFRAMQQWIEQNSKLLLSPSKFDL